MVKPLWSSTSLDLRVLVYHRCVSTRVWILRTSNSSIDRRPLTCSLEFCIFGSQAGGSCSSRAINMPTGLTRPTGGKVYMMDMNSIGHGMVEY